MMSGDPWPGHGGWVFAMPNKATFTIHPIRLMLERVVTDPRMWADPYAGWNSPAGITNDQNENTPAEYHMEALEFCRSLLQDQSLDGALFDPPYSPRQVAEHYRSRGQRINNKTTRSTWWTWVKDVLATKIRVGGMVICFGWNSGGMTVSRGFERVEWGTIYHGGMHNDTIVTIDRKTEHKEFETPSISTTRLDDYFRPLEQEILFDF